jgi:uncharacterized protein with HEPN domain
MKYSEFLVIIEEITLQIDELKLDGIIDPDKIVKHLRFTHKIIDDEFKKGYPHIEWRKMAATRNQFIHHYFGIDYDIFWDIIEKKIPDLHFFIKEILEEHSAK